ncbi:response regulator [Hyalangium rubrum]|uniref:Response regulator n=1 Tax=Hyalangium rubrum TaxID=3103134 RepID=A0ABU5HE15_9BACT|nr:response regulator [Hyalangium sp. s54d21]MDY7231382.1 response regulator [Hyalangium sp. s54d21]
MAQALATVRDGFRSSAPERLAQLRRNADAWKAHTPGAATLFAQSVHSLRGTAGTLGFTEVVRVASELEKLAEGDSPPFSPRVLVLLQALLDAFSQPPSTLSVVPHRPRVLIRLSDAHFAAELIRNLDSFGMDGVHAGSDEEAVRLLTADRPVERVVVGPAVSPALRSALRSTGSPPLLVQLLSASEARNGPREGTDAVLSLGTPAPALARELASLQRTSPTRFRVLAVDDDAAVLAAARAVLEAAGLEVVTLSDARNLFSSLQRHHPDLLLLDVAMPALDGFDLLSQLRSEPAWRNLTVVFHTSRDATSERVRAFQLGVDDYLIKPVEPAELRVRVLAHLQRRALLRAAAEKEATTGLASAHALQRTLARQLESGTAPVAVALLRFPKPEALTEHSARLTPRLRPSDVLARWDERTLALVRAGEDARALQAFLQAPPGTADALLGVADNRAQPSMGAQALLTAAELNLGRGSDASRLERPSMPPRTEGSALSGSRPALATPSKTPSHSSLPAVQPPATRPAPTARPEPHAPPPTRPSGSAPTFPPIRLPTGETPASVAPRVPPTPRPTEPGAAGQPRSHRILVADDEPALRRVLQRLLEQEGYVVETAEDGEEALTRLLNPNLTPVDLLLLDVHMPRRSGIDVLRALREASSPVKALVLSARVRDADVLKLYGEGAADFVAKPFSIHTLLARVTRLLPPRSS